MNTHGQGSLYIHLLQIGLQPVDLLLVNFTHVMTIFTPEDGIQHNKMPALVIKRIKALTNPLFKHLFPKLGMLFNTCFITMPTIRLMIPHRVVYRHFQSARYLLVKLVDRIGPAVALVQNIHHKIAPGEHKIGIQHIDGINGHLKSGNRI